MPTDGGGVAGLSQLIILETIMNHIKLEWGLKKDPLPADYFDLIGGTSIGGLIALLLGRLRLSVPEARREFTRIAQQTFAPPERLARILVRIPFLGPYLRRELFDERRLQAAVRRAPVDGPQQGRGNERLLERGDGDGRCKVFVCARVPQLPNSQRLLRTYEVARAEPYDCSIWEACRATMAAPAYLKGIVMGAAREEEMFVGTAPDCNDPIREVLAETKRAFSPHKKIACAVSIGTGVRGAVKARSSLLPLTTRRRAVEALVRGGDDGRAQEEAKMDKGCEKYFRLNVNACMGGVGFEYWDGLGQVRSFTTKYLDQEQVSEQIREIAKVLVMRGGSTSTSPESSGSPSQT